MTPEERAQVVEMLEAHARTVAVCEACATTTRDLAEEVRRGGTPSQGDLRQTVAEAGRVLEGLAGVRVEIGRLMRRFR
jgi:hypothetical protein